MTAPTIDGLILCGGRAERMGKLDKGLVKLHDQELVRWVAKQLESQVNRILVNANRNIEEYKSLGFEVVSDITPNFAGPLAGFEAGLTACLSEYLLICPCDSPLLPSDLVARLFAALKQSNADLAYAATQAGGRIQTHPVFCLVKKSLLPSLSTFLNDDGRKIDRWFSTVANVEVIFDNELAFSNINTPEELAHIATLVS